MFKECERFRHFVKFSCEQEMELSSPKLKKLLIFHERNCRTCKSNKNQTNQSAPKKCLVSCDVFVIFSSKA